MAKKERKNRAITQNIEENSFEELVSVKRSIYPWDDLADEEKETENFFVECDDLDEARGLKSSVKNSGENYYLKRKIDLVPVIVVAKMKNGKVGLVCSVIPAE